MINAYKFRKTFGIYAAELRDLPEDKFVEWLNKEDNKESDDCISREDLLQFIDLWGGDIESMIEYIKSRPSVTPAREKGYWISVHYITENRNFDTFKCSNCGNEFSWDAETGISARDYDICPSCGAIMRKDERALRL